MRALELGEGSLALYREAGDQEAVAESLNTLADAALSAGDYERAASLYEESLRLARDLSSKRKLAPNLEGLAAVASRSGEMARVARLLGASAALREEVGPPLSPIQRTEHDRIVAKAQETLGREGWEAAWSEGHAATSYVDMA